MSQPNTSKREENRGDDAPVADRGQVYDKAGASELGDENFGAGGDYRGDREFGGFSDQDYGSQGYSGQGYGDRSYGDPDYGGQTFARRGATEPALETDPHVPVEEAIDGGIEGDVDTDTRRPDGEDEEYNDEETRT
jgi:hypothetical protein